jgi:carbon storage regulator CsrA
LTEGKSGTGVEHEAKRRGPDKQRSSTMLVISRRTNEEVKLYAGGELLATVQVVRVAGNVVRLGITALPNVDIRRAELETMAAQGRENCEEEEEHGAPVG